MVRDNSQSYKKDVNVVILDHFDLLLDDNSLNKKKLELVNFLTTICTPLNIQIIIISLIDPIEHLKNRLRDENDTDICSRN